MAKILKQLSTIHGRLFTTDQPPEKSPPADLFIDADAAAHAHAHPLDVYALRRCQSDLSPVYLTRLSLSQDDLHACTLPPARNLLDSLQQFRVKGRGVMRRVRGHHEQRDRTGAGAVSRSDSFKFQSAGERGDHLIMPPSRKGRKKGGAPSMPQLLEDYAAPLDLVNRAKFRQVSRSDTSQLVQVDQDYSDVIDSKDYVTPGDDGTRKIYSAHAGDATLEDEGLETDLPYCQPYSRTNGVTVLPPASDDCSLYDEVSPQSTTEALRVVDPLYADSSALTYARSSRAKRRTSPPLSRPQPESEPEPKQAEADEPLRGEPLRRESDQPFQSESAVYENVQVWCGSDRADARSQLVCRSGALVAGRRRRRPPAARWHARPQLARSCGDLHTAVDDGAIYVNAGDPIVQLERELGRDERDMNRRLYETAFDSAARPPPADPDELPRLAALPVSTELRHAPPWTTTTTGAQLHRAPAAPWRVQSRPAPPVGSDERTTPSRTDGALPPAAASPVRTDEVRAQVRVDVHASPPATTPLPAKFGGQRRPELAGLWDSPQRDAACGEPGSPRAGAGVSAPTRPERGVLRSAGRPRSLCSDQVSTLCHRYECLEVAAGDRTTLPAGGTHVVKAELCARGGDSARTSCSGSSTLSSLESLRSSSDSDSTGRGGDSMSRAHLSADLCRRLATARLPVLSPISDKSQEADSPAEPAPRLAASRAVEPAAWRTPRPRAGSGLYGSDSGISVDSQGDAAAQLPFDMPKLRRKAVAAGGQPFGQLVTLPAKLATPAVQITAEPTVRPALNLSLDRSESATSADPRLTSADLRLTSADPAPRRAVMALSLGCATNAAGESIDLKVPFQQQRWYHGAITRVEAENILRAQKEGSYLVRTCESSRHDYSLSLKSSRGFMHMKIRQDPSSHKYILGQFSKPFDSIPQMIQHYSMTKLPIRGAEHMSLLHPVADDQLL